MNRLHLFVFHSRYLGHKRMELRIIKSFLAIAFSLHSIILLNGCREPGKADILNDIIVIDLTGNYDEITLKLDDFLDDIKLIRLETTEYSLLSYFTGYVGEKHIISMDRDRILLFSADGKYICTIALRGKGPGEFNQIDAWDVDDNEQFLYYHDKGKNHINKYNLSSCKHEENIPFSNKGDLSNMVSVNDTLLAILPGMFAGYGYLYFFQSTTGEIITGKKKEPVPHPGAWAGMTPILKKADNNSIIFQPSDCDTVFIIKEGKIQALISLIAPKPKKNGYITVGTWGAFMHLETDRIFLNKGGYESRITSSSSSFRIFDPEYLVFYIKDNKIYTIKSLYLDYFGMELNNPHFYYSSYNQVVLQFQAMEFKNLIKEALENSQLSEINSARLRHLYNEISENDNPVLISGKSLSY